MLCARQHRVHYRGDVAHCAARPDSGQEGDSAVAKLAFYTFGLLKDVAHHPEAQEFIDRIPSVLHTSDLADGQIDRWGHPE